MIDDRTKARTTAIALVARYGGANAQERATAETTRALRNTSYLFWRHVVEDVADLRILQAMQGDALGRALRQHDRL